MSRAVLLNLSAFLAENNIRRNVATLSANYPGSASQTTFRELNSGETWTFIPSSSVSTYSRILIAHVTGMLSATLVLAPGSELRPVDSMQIGITRLLVIDDELAQVVFYNPGATAVSITLIQG